MASLVQNNAKRAIAAGEIDLDADDIRCALLMNNTTADTEDDKTTLTGGGGFTTLGDCDATGTSRQALTGEAVTTDNPNTRAEFDANDVSFAGLGGDASFAYQGVLIYKFVTTDADHIPIAFIEFTGQLAVTATQVDVPWNVEGILQFT